MASKRLSLILPRRKTDPNSREVHQRTLSCGWRAVRDAVKRLFELAPGRLDRPRPLERHRTLCRNDRTLRPCSAGV